MGRNAEIAAVYNELMTEVKNQIQTEFPDIIWMIETYDDAVHIGRTRIDSNGDERPTGIFLMADRYKGDNRHEGNSIVIPFDDTNEGVISEDFRLTILEAAKELRLKLINGILI